MDQEPIFDANYEYNCPQFVDFSVPYSNDDRADEYFDIDHEGRGEEYGFTAEPDMQIPEEFEEPEAKPDDSGEHVRGEERLSDVPHQEESVNQECVEHPKESIESHQESVEHPIATLKHNTEHEEHSADSDDPSVNTADALASSVEQTVASVAESVEHVTESVEEPVVSVEHPKPMEHPEPMEHTEPMEKSTAPVDDSTESSRHPTESKVQPTESTEDSQQTDSLQDGTDENLNVTQDIANTDDNVEHMAQSDNKMVVLEAEKNTEVSQEKSVPEESPESPQVETHREELQEEVPTKHAPSNLRTVPWETSTTQRQTRKSVETTRPRRSLRRSLQSKRASAGSVRSQSPALKKRRVSDRSLSGSRRSAAVPAARPAKLKLTLPTTPTVMKRNVTKPGTQFKTTEEREMEQIAGFRKQLAARKKQAQASYKMVHESTGYQAVKAVVPPTKPVGFTFETDQRIKEHPMATRQDARSFESVLRNGKARPAKMPHGPTVPEPFKLTESRKRKFGSEGGKNSPYRSMATTIQQFHAKTPERFHTRRSGDQQHKDNSMHREEVHKPKLTHPKTPNLESRNRKRAITVQSAAEKEEQELQEMHNYKFKAKPVNPKVMSNINLGVKMPAQKKPTKAIGFNLESERRMKEREVKKAQEDEEKKEEQYEFHARPVSSKMLEGPVGIAPAKPRTLTCPKSPAFALKNRISVREEAPEPEEPKSRIIHAKPIFHVGVPFKPQTTHKTTETQPFSFEERDKEIQARKEAKIQEIYQEEEEARHFKAKPILENTFLPKKVTKPVTKLEPFSLANDEKGAKRAELWSKKMEEELNEQRAKANSFKAKPANVVYNEPFIPQKQNKPLTEINAFNLNTDRRAVEREEMEQIRLRKELEERESRHLLEKMKEEEERREVERMRREDMVPRAQPIKHYKAVNVIPSSRPLTDPCSPKFSDRFQK